MLQHPTNIRELDQKGIFHINLIKLIKLLQTNCKVELIMKIQANSNNKNQTNYNNKNQANYHK